MLSLNRFLSCLLVVTLYAPLRSTCFNFSFTNSTVPDTTVEWIRSDTDPLGPWKVVVAALNGQPQRPNSAPVPNSNESNGSFPLEPVLQPYHQRSLRSVTLQAFIVQNDGSLGNGSFGSGIFQIPASQNISNTAGGIPTLSVSLPVSPVSSPSSSPHFHPPPNRPQGMASHREPKSSTTIAIIGAVIGSVAILLTVAILLFLWWRNRRRRLRKTYPEEFSREKMVREVEPANYASNIFLKHQSMSSDSGYTESTVYSENGGRPPLEGLDPRVHEV